MTPFRIRSRSVSRLRRKGVVALQNAILLIRLEYPRNLDCEALMDTLPYVAAALICERVMQEKDGTLSAIRIVDRAEIKIQTNDPNVKLQDVNPAVQLTGLISIKSGPFKGKGMIRVDGESPSGKVVHLADFPVDLVGDDSGQNFVLGIVIASQEDGLHWFNVHFNDNLLSRIPLRLARALEQFVPGAQTNQSPKT